MIISTVGGREANVPAPGSFRVSRQRQAGERSASGRLISPPRVSGGKRLEMEWRNIRKAEALEIAGIVGEDFCVRPEDGYALTEGDMAFRLSRGEMASYGMDRYRLSVEAEQID